MLSMNQLVNVAAKSSYMYGGRVKVPLVVRSMIGKSWGQGAQHSQGLYSFFMHVPGLKVVAPTTPYDAKGCLIAAIRDDNPVMYVEHRILHFQKGPVPEKSYSVEPGKARVTHRGEDVTLVGISYMQLECLRAQRYLEDVGISAEVIDPIWLAPLDVDTIAESVAKTGRLCVVDNGWTTCGASAEIVAQVMERLQGTRDIRVHRHGIRPGDVPDLSAARGRVLSRCPAHRRGLQRSRARQAAGLASRRASRTERRRVQGTVLRIVMTGLGSLSASSRHRQEVAVTRLAERARDAWWCLRRRPLPMVLLQDQRSLTVEELARAHSIIDWIEQVIEARPGYLKRHRLNEEIHFPQAIWALDQGAGLYDGFRAVLSRDPRVAQSPAAMEPAIHGYRLFSMESAECRPFPHPDEIGAAADRRLAALAPHPIAGSAVTCGWQRNCPHLCASRRRGSSVKSAGMSTAEPSRTTAMSISNAWPFCTSAVCSIDCGRSRRQAARRMSSRSAEASAAWPIICANLIPQLRIVIVDIPESLIFSSLYLSLSLPDGTHIYARPEEPADTFRLRRRPVAVSFRTTCSMGCSKRHRRFDLAINTLSMSEMDAAQVEYYCLGLDQLLSDDGLFFEQNQNNMPIGRLDAQTLIARHFGRRQDLRSRLVGSLTQGTAHLWSQRRRALPQQAGTVQFRRQRVKSHRGSPTAAHENRPRSRKFALRFPRGTQKILCPRPLTFVALDAEQHHAGRPRRADRRFCSKTTRSSRSRRTCGPSSRNGPNGWA